MLSRIVYPLSWLIARAVMELLGGLRAEGREHVPKGRGVILAANHISHIDPPVVGLMAPRSVWFLAKEPLFRIPVLGTLARLLHAFPVRQGSVDREALRRSDEILKAGGILIIFPEGGCSHDGALLPFRPGLALIALRSGAPIVPTAVVGTRSVMPLGAPWPRRVSGGMVVRFGAPIETGNLLTDGERKEQVAVLTARVEAAVRELLEQ